VDLDPCCRLRPRVFISTWSPVGRVYLIHVADCRPCGQCATCTKYTAETSATCVLHVADMSRRVRCNTWLNGEVGRVDTWQIVHFATTRSTTPSTRFALRVCGFTGGVVQGKSKVCGSSTRVFVCPVGM